MSASRDATPKIERVLVAADLSPASDVAIRRADAWAKRHAAKLLVCHAVTAPKRSEGAQHTSYEQLRLSRRLDLETHALKARVETLTGRNEHGYEHHVTYGAPDAEILNAAERYHADLLVVGDSHRGTLRDVLFGGVRRKLLARASCPVLTAREGAQRGGVLVGVDFSDPSFPALRAAAEEALRRDTPLVALHAIETWGWPGPSGLGAHFLEGQLAQIACASVHQRFRWALHQLGIRADVRVVQAPVRWSLMATALEIDAQLIVVGTVGRTGLRRLALGNVAEAITRSARCSVLTVRLRREHGVNLERTSEAEN